MRKNAVTKSYFTKKTKHTNKILSCFRQDEEIAHVVLRKKLIKKAPPHFREDNRFDASLFIGHESQLDKELKKLCAQKVLIKRKEGKQRYAKSYYRINPNRLKEVLRYANKATDLYQLEQYSSKELISPPGVSIYGLKPEVFDTHEDRTSISTKGYRDLHRKGVMLTKYKQSIRISPIEAIKQIVEQLIELKKKHRLTELEKIYSKELSKVKSNEFKILLNKHKELFLAFLNSTDQDEQSISEVIDMPARLFSGFRRLEDGSTITTAYGEDISKAHVRDILTLNRQIRLRLGKFLFRVIRPLWSEGWYPTAVSIVGHSSSAVFLDDLQQEIDKIKHAPTS